ncbi:formin-like protein 6 [Tanacetum coccineum]|uniref:Formin-like protein 6 n=1 Tax=Tanacetum coccineum TaxID=301880 RepID=A0ABQ4XSG4_9ASTR
MSSVKLRRVMQTILSLGNALNQGTSRAAAFKLDSLLKLNNTRAKRTLMHYLCKVQLNAAKAALNAAVKILHWLADKGFFMKTGHQAGFQVFKFSGSYLHGLP